MNKDSILFNSVIKPTVFLCRLFQRFFFLFCRVSCTFSYRKVFHSTSRRSFANKYLCLENNELETKRKEENSSFQSVKLCMITIDWASACVKICKRNYRPSVRSFVVVVVFFPPLIVKRNYQKKHLTLISTGSMCVFAGLLLCLVCSPLLLPSKVIKIPSLLLFVLPKTKRRRET